MISPSFSDNWLIGRMTGWALRLEDRGVRNLRPQDRSPRSARSPFSPPHADMANWTPGPATTITATSHCFRQVPSRSPDTATAEDVRCCQVHLTATGGGSPTLNGSASRCASSSPTRSTVPSSAGIWPVCTTRGSCRARASFSASMRISPSDASGARPFSAQASKGVRCGSAVTLPPHDRRVWRLDRPLLCAYVSRPVARRCS